MRDSADNTLVIQALVQYARELEDHDSDCADQALLLAEEIASQHGLTIADALRRNEC